MRFSVIIAGVFAAVASAQSETSSAVSSAESSATSDASITSAASGASSSVVASTTVDAVSSSVSIDPAQASTAACLKACDLGDVTCQAACISVPSPDTTNVNKTTECVAACPQGNGTATDNLDYANCVNQCIAEYYYSTAGSASTATGTGASGSGVSATPSVTEVHSTVTSDGSTFVTSFSSTVAASGTGSSDSASSTSSSAAAADMLFSPIGSGLGLFSFLAAFLAL